MKSRYLYYLIGIFYIFLTGCVNSGSEGTGVAAERDSLRAVNDMQMIRLRDYEQTVSLLNSTLDSIAYEEKMIFVNAGNMEVPVTKDIVRQNLDRFELILNRQKDRIRVLEAKLKERNDSSDKSLSLISHLQEQIQSKNIQIVHLKKELEKKNVDISKLQELVESQKYTIDSQNITIEELNKRTQKQNEALARQDAILNQGYVLLGTKADLQRKGILKKGRLVSESMLDRSKFMQVDIKKWREVTFVARKPGILTNMPASSYEITTDGNGNFTLNVLSPSDFWKLTSYLIIQTD